MKLCQFLLRLCSPRCEKQRMEYRQVLARANAEAEDLTRTISANADDIRASIERVRNAKVTSTEA